jgi:hypothetical protein
LDCRHVCKPCAFHNALQARKQKEVHPLYSPDMAPVWQRFCDQFLKRPLLTVSRTVMKVAKSVLWRMAIILEDNKIKLFLSSVFFSGTIHRNF